MNQCPMISYLTLFLGYIRRKLGMIRKQVSNDRYQLFLLVKEIANMLGVPFPEGIIWGYIQNLPQQKIEQVKEVVRKWVQT